MELVIKVTTKPDTTPFQIQNRIEELLNAAFYEAINDGLMDIEFQVINED